MGGLIRSQMIFQYPDADANVCVCTLHIAHLGVADVTNADIDAASTLLKDWWDTGVGGELSMKSYTNSECRLLQVQSSRIDPGPPTVPRIVVVNTSGTLATAGMPPQMCIVLSWRTGVAGRSFRGRTYWPGVTESLANAAGAMPAVDQQNLADRAKGLIAAADALFGGDGKLVVYSRKLGSGEAVVDVRVGSRIDVQRRRKIRAETYVVGT